MEYEQFKEKYRISNFENYSKENASIEYWQNLIIKYDIDKSSLIGLDSFRTVFDSELRLNHKDFKDHCLKQIELIKINNQFIDKEVIQIITQFEHSNIFVGNAYEVWKKLFNDFNIKGRNSRDLDFMFAAMQNKGLIHEYITLTNMVNWINKNHGDYQCEKLKFSDIKDNSNKNRVTIFEGIIANTKI